MFRQSYLKLHIYSQLVRHMRVCLADSLT